MMNRNSAETARLEAAGYMQPGHRPRCGNCKDRQHDAADTKQTASLCTRHYAQVARDGLCGFFVPAEGAKVGAIVASRRGRSGRVDVHKDLLLMMAARPDGITNGQLADAANISSKAAGTKLGAYTKRLMLFAAKGKPTRWFATQQAADAWLAGPGKAELEQAARQAEQMRATKPLKAAKGEPKPGHTLLAKPKPGLDPTVKGNTTGHKPTGAATNPNNVQPQYGRHYTHDTRVQCAPDEQPYGAGFAASQPGINPMTNQPWEARA